MSRKSLLTFAAAATLAAATLSTQSADAMGFGRGGFGGGAGFARSVGRGPVLGPHFPVGHLGGGNGRIIPIFRGPRHPIVPIVPIPVNNHPIDPPIILPPPDRDHHHHHHHHWVFRGGHWILIDVDDELVEASPVIAPAEVPGPCTCLTKTYTQTGLVVFADVCTKESASAPVDAAVTGEATQEPTTPVAASAVPMSVVPTAPNYAGRTYEDYLAANGQSSAPQAAAPQTPAAPQKN
jgi:hypothetical protein